MAENGSPGTGEEIVVEVDPDLEDLIPMFLDNRRKDVKVLTGALAGGDFEKIRFVGHDMKGAGGGYGFRGISEIGSRLEEAAKNGDHATIEDCIHDLSDYLRRVRVATG
jgi:HPt (histidine-containing phosphotransfer) domain-containing protein